MFIANILINVGALKVLAVINLLKMKLIITSKKKKGLFSVLFYLKPSGIMGEIRIKAMNIFNCSHSKTLLKNTGHNLMLTFQIDNQTSFLCRL